jgi:transposase
VSTSGASGRVVIGMDPHKRSATVEVMTGDETIVGGERFATDRDGFAAMLRYVGQSPDRVWAIECCAGIGKHIAMRLLADGEDVVDVPPKLSASSGPSFHYPRQMGMFVPRNLVIFGP